MTGSLGVYMLLEISKGAFTLAFESQPRSRYLLVFIIESARNCIQDLRATALCNSTLRTRFFNRRQGKYTGIFIEMFEVDVLHTVCCSGRTTEVFPPPTKYLERNVVTRRHSLRTIDLTKKRLSVCRYTFSKIDTLKKKKKIVKPRLHCQYIIHTKRQSTDIL